MVATKSKPQSLSARRSSPPRTRSKPLPETNPSPRTLSKPLPETSPSPRTHSKPQPETNPSPRTHPQALPKPDFPPTPRTPASLGAITPIGTRKSVTLSDWWLTRKGKDKKKKALCIIGFESDVRLFSSGTILKRHNSVTLESVDGITISIGGFINRSLSIENGVSEEVCNRFLLGFPFNWEDYNEENVVEEDRGFVVKFDDVPVNRIEDLSFVDGCLKDKILVDVVASLRDLVSCPKSDEKKKKSVAVGEDESLVSSAVVVGVKTRAMRRRDEFESSSGKRPVCTKSTKKKKLA
ncbi:PREDICTED: protein EMBRYO DEFECTIVE 1674-like [Camelina sativa]|uniref:Protein EMBRYO DEFECTIVE 1674-like n=1 Tax=Camelina sativa TaxID=90675 RepID=A0ABM0WFB7_CAMSA|nr:PREDICTED: protein EMBRYO DEFECTIVE 1674-like [Camelina sativa]